MFLGDFVTECIYTNLHGTASYYMVCATLYDSSTVCFHQHRHKHVSNELCYDVMTATILLGDNFQLHYNFMGLLFYMRSIVDQNVIMWCMTVDHKPQRALS